eukprot:UN00714
MKKKAPVSAAKRSFKQSTAQQHKGAYVQYTKVHNFIEPEPEPEDYVISVFPPQPWFDKPTRAVTTPLPRVDHGAQSVGRRFNDVVIYKPTKNVMQNEKNSNWKWRIREQGANAFVNQTTNGDDYYADTKFYPKFNSKQEAIEWCKFEGIKFEVEEEPVVKYPMRSYADNFSHYNVYNKPAI